MIRVIAILFALIVSVPALSGSDTFHTLKDFGNNPGNLKAYYVPAEGADTLVVLLHGCTQDSRQLARETGLLKRLQEQHIALLLPQQKRLNNVSSCFNWFSKEDQSSGGEMRSILDMIASVQKADSVERVALVGFSAGAAMASNLVAHHPQRFIAAVMMAGVPYPCADSLVKAISCMRKGPAQGPRQLAALLDVNASPGLPDIVVVSGLEDDVVNPDNSRVMAAMWALHLGYSPGEFGAQQLQGVHRQKWSGNRGEVELWLIDELDHAWPVDLELLVQPPESEHIKPARVDLSTLLLNKISRVKK